MKNKQKKDIFGLWFKTKHLKIFFVVKPLCLIFKKRKKEVIIEEGNQQERLHVSPGIKGKEWRERAIIPLFSTWATVSVIADSFWLIQSGTQENLKCHIWPTASVESVQIFLSSFPPSEESFCVECSAWSDGRMQWHAGLFHTRL